MNINYQALKQIVDKARFKYGEEFSYLGIDFLLFSDISDNQDAFYQHSSLVDWDIYIITDRTSRKFRKPILLHEILEAEQLGTLMKKGMNREEAGNQAHKTARIYDDKYAKELFDNQTYKMYCQFRKEKLNGSK